MSAKVNELSDIILTLFVNNRFLTTKGTKFHKVLSVLLLVVAVRNGYSR
jgi:hypothetical protein